jgi:hypothetical protein
VTSVWLGNDQKNYAAHIIGATLRYRFESGQREPALGLKARLVS